MKRRGFFSLLLAPFLAKLIPSKPKLFEWTTLEGKPINVGRQIYFLMHPAQKKFFEEYVNANAPFYYNNPRVKSVITDIEVPEGY